LNLDDGFQRVQTEKFVCYKLKGPEKS
jgi:hypothetical protein